MLSTWWEPYICICTDMATVRCEIPLARMRTWAHHGAGGDIPSPSVRFSSPTRMRANPWASRGRLDTITSFVPGNARFGNNMWILVRPDAVDWRVN